MNTKIRLDLIGEPTLYLGGQARDIRPRAVFELLAVIICAGRDGISRSQVADRLWGHLDRPNSRLQLRIAAHKIRDELRQYGLTESFDLGEKHLRFLGEADVDIIRIPQSTKKTTLGDLEAMVKPIAQGWNPEHWLAEQDAFGEYLAKRFERIERNPMSDHVLIQLLVKATRAYPTTISFYLQLGILLRQQGRIAEHEEMIIAFEDRWVDRFGTNEIPDLQRLSQEFIPLSDPPEPPVELEPAHVLVTPPPPEMPTRRGIMPKPVIVASVLVVAVVFSARGFMGILDSQKPTIIATTWPPMHVRVNTTFHVGNQEFRLIQLQIPGIHAEDITRLSKDEWLISEELGNNKRQFIVHADGTFEMVTTQRGWSMLNRNLQVSIIKPSENLVLTENGIVKIEGTTDRPKVKFYDQLADGSLLFDRRSAHPFIDDYDLTRWSAKGDEPIYQGKPVPQITLPTLLQPDTLYFKYNWGRKDQWHFHSAKYDVNSHRMQLLTCPQVVGLLSDGSLLTRPEITVIEDGDFETHADGHMQMVRPDGTTTDVRVGDKKLFASWLTLGNFLGVGVAHHSFFQVTYLDGKTLKPISVPLPNRVSQVLASKYHDAYLLRVFNENVERYEFDLISPISK